MTFRHAEKDSAQGKGNSQISSFVLSEEESSSSMSSRQVSSKRSKKSRITQNDDPPSIQVIGPDHNDELETMDVANSTEIVISPLAAILKFAKQKKLEEEKAQQKKLEEAKNPMSCLKTSNRPSFMRGMTINVEPLKEHKQKKPKMAQIADIEEPAILRR